MEHPILLFLRKVAARHNTSGDFIARVCGKHRPLVRLRVPLKARCLHGFLVAHAIAHPDTLGYNPERSPGIDKQILCARKRIGVTDKGHKMLAVDNNREFQRSFHDVSIDGRPARAFELAVQHSRYMKGWDDWQYLSL